jgi:hypothetical protein
MRVSTVAVLASTLFGFASAQKFQQVEVGTPDAKLLFNPPTVDGFGPGDVIQFIFYPKAQSVLLTVPSIFPPILTCTSALSRNPHLPTLALTTVLVLTRVCRRCVPFSSHLLCILIGYPIIVQ